MKELRIGITTSSFASANSEPLHLLENAGVEVITNPFGRKLSEEEIFYFIEDKDGLVAGLEPLNRRVLTHAKRLKAIARVGIGIDNVDLIAAAELGITVSNTPDGPTQAVAEMTVTAVLAITRRLREVDRLMHDGHWEKKISKGLAGQNVLFVGYGRIGRRTAELMRVFGARILVADPYLDPDDLKMGETHLPLVEALPMADIVSLHASGHKTIIGKNEFDRMKNNAVLLNSARGSLVSEDALISALDSRKLSMAWFDAFWEEPYSGRLLQYENVLLTPHVCTYTEPCRLAMEKDAAINLLRDLGIRG